MREPPVRWGTYAVLSIGVLLRVALTILLPTRFAYDDHYPPIEIVAHEQRIPLAHECWECHQPPLYYVLAATVYSAAEQTAAACGAATDRTNAAARKTVQTLSTVAGCLTLLGCLGILRRAGPFSAEIEAIALGCVSLLPQHLYMSAMATNDALTYLLATSTIWAALRANAIGWRPGSTLQFGALAGSTVLCKGYGWVTVAAILFVLVAHQIVRPGKSRRWRPTLIFGITSILVGIGPNIRNVAHYHRMHMDNTDFFRTSMLTQPPGAFAAVDFHSIRLASLLTRPWIHESHLASFWTELYARYWFDYEGLSLTLGVSPEWRAFWRGLHLKGGIRTRDEWDRILRWDSSAVPGEVGRVAVVSYAAGIPITLVVLAGLGITLMRGRREFAYALLGMHFLACLSVPVVQTLRLPYFSAMKAAFTLSALSSAPVLIARGLNWKPSFAADFCRAVMWLALVMLLVCNIAILIWIGRHAA